MSDPRRSQGIRYELKFVLFFIVLAIMANAKSYRNIEDFIETHLKKLNKTFNIKWKRSPDFTQIRNIVKAINKDSMEEVFRMYSKELNEPNTTNHKIFIAFDGKTLRGSIDNFQDKKALQELFAYETNGKIILAHIDIDEKSNEIPAVQELIQNLNLSNCVFTMDALHCQKKLYK
jgi:hypothetical protein